MLPESDSAQGTSEGEWPEGSTLAQLQETLGPLVIHIACAPRGTDARVGVLVIQDADEPVQAETDGMLLLVGSSPQDGNVTNVIKCAGDGRYTAVVLKARGADLTEVIEASESAGVALVVVPDSMPWRHLDALLTAAANESGALRATYSSVGIGDLFSLANAIAYNVGGAVTIEDPQGRVLAYSNLPHQEIDEVRRQGILGRRTPDRPTNVDEYRRVWNSERPVWFVFNSSEHADRLAMAVRAGSQLLGLIWVLASNPRLADGAERALEDAARNAAIHLLRGRTRREPDRWSRREAFTSLLEGATAAPVAAVQLDLSVDTPVTLLAVAAAGESDTAAVDATRIVDLLGLYCEAWHPHAVSATVRGTTYALLPTHADDGAPARVAKFAHDVAMTARRTTGRELHIVTGSVSGGLAGIPSNRRTADLALRALRSSSQGTRVATVEELASRVTLMELVDRTSSLSGSPNDPVGRIVEHDAQNATSYAKTLLAYLDAFGEAGPAAAAVVVHENTLRYRVRRLQELFDLRLDDPDVRLVTWLQLKLHELSAW